MKTNLVVRFVVVGVFTVAIVLAICMGRHSVVPASTPIEASARGDQDRMVIESGQARALGGHAESSERVRIYAADSPDASDIYRIRVQDEEGNPVAGVRLGVLGESGSASSLGKSVSWLGLSSDLGLFTLRGVLASVGNVVAADKASFLSSCKLLTHDARDITFVMRKKGRAHVTVKDWQGRPIEGARVAVSVQWPHSSSLRVHDQWPSELQSPGMPNDLRREDTDVRGVAIFDDLVCGQSVFHASYPGHAVGGKVNDTCFAAVEPAEVVHVDMVMLPIFGAVVDCRNQNVAKHAWSSVAQVAIPGLATIDVHSSQKQLADRFPDKLVYSYIAPAQVIGSGDEHAILRVMSMDGAWSQHKITTFPVQEFHEANIAALPDMRCTTKGCVIRVVDVGQCKGLGIRLHHVESGEAWGVGGQSEMLLPRGEYYASVRDALLARAIDPAVLEKFIVFYDRVNSYTVAYRSGFYRCKISVVDELQRPIRNFRLSVRACESDQWVEWLGSFLLDSHVVSVLQAGAPHDFRVEANGFQSTVLRLAPSRSESIPIECDDIKITLKELLTGY